VVRSWAVFALVVLMTACQNETHPAFSPAPSPTPRTAPTAAILQDSDVPMDVAACPGSGSLDSYISNVELADLKLAAQWSAQWADLRSRGARAGAISIYAADTSIACSAELGATALVKALASVVIQFGDEGQADRAWEAGVFGFTPPAPGQLQAGMVRGNATGLGSSSFTYTRPSVRLACWRHSVYVALVAVSNSDLATFKAATASIDPRLN
jgi:hypothetical protein